MLQYLTKKCVSIFFWGEGCKYYYNKSPSGIRTNVLKFYIAVPQYKYHHAPRYIFFVNHCLQYKLRNVFALQDRTKSVYFQLSLIMVYWAIISVDVMHISSIQMGQVGRKIPRNSIFPFYVNGRIPHYGNRKQATLSIKLSNVKHLNISPMKFLN